MKRTDKGVVIGVALLWIGVGATLITHGAAKSPVTAVAETSPTGSRLVIPATGNSALATVPVWPSATSSAAATVKPKIKSTPVPKRAVSNKPKPARTRTSSPRTSFANCTELRKVYPDGVPQGHSAYRSKMDKDQDGWACE